MKRTLWLPATLLTVLSISLGLPACLDRGNTCAESGRCLRGEFEGPPSAVPTQQSCVEDADCSDGNLCTRDTCNFGACTRAALSDGRVMQTAGCVATVCSGGEEHEQAVAPGALCEGGLVCDAAGSCVACDAAHACPAGRTCGKSGSCGVDLGGDCVDDLACASGHCVDGRCCKLGCDTECLTCNASAGYSQCALIPLGEAHAACTDAQLCDGLGHCKSAEGQPCAAPEECLSGVCDAGVCAAIE